VISRLAIILLAAVALCGPEVHARPGRPAAARTDASAAHQGGAAARRVRPVPARTGAGQPRTGRSLGRTRAAPAAPAFEPGAYLRGKGLDPEQLRFELVSYDRALGFGWGELSAIYRGKPVGSLQIRLDEASGRPRGVHPKVMIEGPLRGKGLGTLLYLVAARAAWQTDRRVLGNDTVEMSDDAAQVWAGLARRGLASEDRTIREDALRGGALRPLGAWADARTTRVHETRESFYGVPPALERSFAAYRRGSPDEYRRAFDEGMIRTAARARPGEFMYREDLRRLEKRYPELARIHRRLIRAPPVSSRQ
jgi:hypothetical protein